MGSTRRQINAHRKPNLKSALHPSPDSATIESSKNKPKNGYPFPKKAGLMYCHVPHTHLDENGPKGPKIVSVALKGASGLYVGKDRCRTFDSDETTSE